MVEKVKSIFDGNKTWARLCLLLWIDGFLLTFDEWRIATAHPRDSLSPDVAAYVNTSDAISLFYLFRNCGHANECLAMINARDEFNDLSCHSTEDVKTFLSKIDKCRERLKDTDSKVSDIEASLKAMRSLPSEWGSFTIIN